MLFVQYSSYCVFNTSTSANGYLDHSEEPILKVFAVEHLVETCPNAGGSVMCSKSEEEGTRHEVVIGD